MCVDCNDTGFIEELTYWDKDDTDYMYEEKPCASCGKYEELVNEKDSPMYQYVIALKYKGTVRFWDGEGWKAVGKPFRTPARAKTYATVNMAAMKKLRGVAESVIIIQECLITMTGAEFEL